MSSQILEEWQELNLEYKQLEANNETYLQKLKDLKSYQQKCISQIAHQRYRISQITEHLKNFKHKTTEEEEHLQNLNIDMMKREVDLQNMELSLPRTTGKYLRVVLGNIDVSFLTNEEKLKYKDEYEKFKLVSQVIRLIIVLFVMWWPLRLMEIFTKFFLLWYYCTLTIRESILKANGSRIKGWWRLHHVLSMVASGVLLVWPNNAAWQAFRMQYLYHSVYTCFLQYCQFKYQKGTLYRLKALGQRNNMDITVDGFHKWMWRGLSFLLPLLFVDFLIQLANGIVLYKIGNSVEDATWHVWVLSFMFFVFFVGNTVTTIMVVPNKMKKKMQNQYRWMTQKVINSTQWSLESKDK